eukprot:jgi/Psemu1/293498/fgenesh1_pg.2510_\
MSVPAATSAKKSFVVTDASQDIPIFLRKTYCMVDTCDPEVCSWSEDGETFIVKHPQKFEKLIIPQFFKHSKFSSFVRQLNFYAFRKIKTNDSIRIDAALEAATANYWRFFHPKFQKGKPEWLQEIKRSSSTPRGSGAKKTNGEAEASSNNSKSAAPDSVESSAALGKENCELKSEVTILKERINDMTKNIEVLTTLVQNVSIAQKTNTQVDVDAPVVVNENNKRAKTAVSQSEPREPLQPSKTTCVPVPDAISSNIAVPDGAPSMPSLAQSCPSDTGALDSLCTIQPNLTGDSVRESSKSPDLSDQQFVDTLFVDLKEDDAGYPFPDTDSMNSMNIMQFDSGSFLDSTPLPSTSVDDANINRPRDELMVRLSEALSLLPRDIQELIVDRLIQAITSPKEIRESLQVTEALEEVVTTTNSMASGVPMSVPQSPRHTCCGDDSAMMTDDDRSTAAASVVPASAAASPSPKPVPNPSLPLAAATLAALLSQYGKEPKCTAAVVAATNTLIPVHV